MQQRQLRLGDILDDYCPRERRVTNHAVVAMVGPDVKQTRCTTCDAEHEYKHAKVPRQRRKTETPAALIAQVAAGAPKRVSHEEAPAAESDPAAAAPVENAETADVLVEPSDAPLADGIDAGEEDNAGDREGEGPVHRPLIRASLPRPEGQAPPARPLPEFTIRQPGGRANRFRPRHFRGGGSGGGFASDRSNGNNNSGSFRGGGMGRGSGGRPPQGGHPRHNRRHDHGRKRSK
jgi:hypothetical protein